MAKSLISLPAILLACLQFSVIQSKPLVLVVSFDGFRHSYLNQGLTPLLQNLSATGATVPYMIPCFPSKTFPNHQSIATGLYPETHGVVDNNVYDSLYGETLPGNRDPRFWNYDENVLPLWIRNEQQGGVSGTMMWPGSDHPYGKDSNLRPTYYYPGYNSSVTWESRVDSVVSWMTHATKPANLVYMYFNQPDSAGHTYGPNNQNTLNQVRQSDDRVKILLDKLKAAGIYEQVNLILLSDHGMEEVSSDRQIDLSTFVDATTMVQDVNGDSPVIQVVPKSGQSTALYAALESGCRTRNCTVFQKSGALCTEPYYYCKGRRIHNFVTLADSGWAFKTLMKSGDEPDATYYGSHGYLNTVESMRAYLIINGPDFKNGYMATNPVKNIDIVPLLSQLLQLTNIPTNGTLSRIEGMLK